MIDPSIIMYHNEDGASGTPSGLKVMPETFTSAILSSLRQSPRHKVIYGSSHYPKLRERSKPYPISYMRQIYEQKTQRSAMLRNTSRRLRGPSPLEHHTSNGELNNRLHRDSGLFI